LVKGPPTCTVAVGLSRRGVLMAMFNNFELKDSQNAVHDQATSRQFLVSDLALRPVRRAAAGPVRPGAAAWSVTAVRISSSR
jgi:hypothetical protein